MENMHIKWRKEKIWIEKNVDLNNASGEIEKSKIIYF